MPTAGSPSPSRRTSCRRWRPRSGTSGVEAVAVCLLHAYAHPAHEARLRAALEGQVPFVSASHEINAEYREYERTATTALNAAVMPLADRYLADLEASLARRGCRRDAPPAPVERRHDVGGGRAPAARSPWPCPAQRGASRRRGSSLGPFGLRNAIAFDMGGTTTDVCLIADGRGRDPAPAAAGRAPGAAALGRRRVDRRGRGLAGPGRAARRSGSGRRARGPGRVRPCYGLGGHGADRHRRARGGGHAPGRRAPRRDASASTRARARAALEPVARALGLGLHEAAAGVLEVANAAMRRAIRLISVQRGRDLRDFTLIAYGGAGPLHAGRLAQELGMPRVVVPAHAGRLLGARLRRGRGGLRPRPDLPSPARRAGGGRARCAVRAAGRRRCARRSSPRATGRRRSSVRAERRRPLRRPELRARGGVGRGRRRRSARASMPSTGASTPTRPDDAAGVREPPRPRRGRGGGGAAAGVAGDRDRPAVRGARGVLPRDRARPRLPVYRREDLPPEHPVKGPALIEDPWATTLVYPSHTALLDRAGNLWMGAGSDFRRRESDCDGPMVRACHSRRRGNVWQSEPEPGHAGGRAARDLRDRGGDEPHHHALGALARSSRRRATCRARSPTRAAGSSPRAVTSPSTSA